MWDGLRHKHRAQVGVMAPFVIIGLLGVVGLVIDIGYFRLIDTELENAADAAALAAAWYDPVCPGDPTDLANPYDVRCAPNNAPGMAPSVAQRFGGYNLGLASVLCGSPLVIAPADVLVHTIQSPYARAVTVIVHCRAGYLVGRILGLDSTEITRWATAAIGEEHSVTGTDGSTRANMGDYNAPPGTSAFLIATLVPQ